MAVISFPNGHATLMETAPGVSVDQVRAATTADLMIADRVAEMTI
jgi:acetate CoA/acetoacetate CoA-transferase beta subunit